MFYVIESSMGMAGDTDFTIVEAGSQGEAEETIYEGLMENLSAFSLGGFDNEDEAEEFLEEQE